MFGKPFYLGMDGLFEKAEAFMRSQAKALNYPPFNIRKEGDNAYVLEVAVAGFGESDLKIELDDGVLKIQGSVSAETPNDNEKTPYLYKGIATRNFERAFLVSDKMEVKNAQLTNGMLRVFLENMVALQSPKSIPINKAPTQADVLGTAKVS